MGAELAHDENALFATGARPHHATKYYHPRECCAVRWTVILVLRTLFIEQAKEWPHSLTNRTLAQAAPKAIPQPLLVSSFTNSAPEFDASGVAMIL